MEGYMHAVFEPVAVPYFENRPLASKELYLTTTLDPTVQWKLLSSFNVMQLRL